MNLNRPDMTETVKSENYTNKFLQKDSNPTTMEVVTQTNAVKSPTDSPATTKLVYTVEEIARMLAISLRSAYNLCNRLHECWPSACALLTTCATAPPNSVSCG